MKAFIQPVHRPTAWLAFGCLAFLLFALAACGGAASPSSSSSSSGSNASTGNTSVMTVSIQEHQDAAGKDVYYFDQTSITIKQGDTITIQNRSDELQDLDKGDAQKAGVDIAIPINQSGTMTFKTAGTFTIMSEKGATITITVQ